MTTPVAFIGHLTAGRAQMGTSLAFHLTFAVLGVGLPFMMLMAEGMHLRTGDPVWRALARRWAKAFAILFAVGAVSGTIISFELGLLWPGFMRYAGPLIGMPFPRLVHAKLKAAKALKVKESLITILATWAGGMMYMKLHVKRSKF